MNVLSVVGARPQFVKLAPVADELRRAGHRHVIVHTGQHYDARMSDVFFDDLAIPSPDVHLGVGSGSHGVQTGRMLAELDPVLDQHRPDWVLVYGDTNSTVAAALAAVKLHLPLAHLEAGLRSFNRTMPEEHNRVLTDHAADLLLAPTAVAMGHLAREGLAARSVLVGDVMTDICLRVRDKVSGSRPADVRQHVGDGDYVLATVHRAANTDDPARLSGLVAALRAFELPVLLTAHPRLVARANDAGVPLEGGALRTVPPLSYPDLVAALDGARAVVTDSGGLQKEAYLLGTICTTLRSETEWPETLQAGWNVLVPGDLSDLGAVALRPPPWEPVGSPYGNGLAAHAAVAALKDGMSGRADKAG
jgi:UDP-N-acetylglucosamine 2-epimerase (non-hydrolysing)